MSDKKSTLNGVLIKGKKKKVVTKPIVASFKVKENTTNDEEITVKQQKHV